MPSTPEIRANEEILSLMMLGLSWIQREASSNCLGWVGYGVLETLYVCGGIFSDSQRRILATAPKQSLRDYALRHTYLLDVPRGKRSSYRPTSENRDTKKLIDTTDKWLIAIVNTNGNFFGDKLFIPSGYCLFLSRRGLERATTLAEAYATEITPETFLTKWRQNRAQMRAMHARRNKNDPWV